jgi:hypothetical protein
MDAKEKALELYKYYEQLGRDFTRGVSMVEFAKLCALIAVDEILNAWPHKYDLETEYFRDGEPINVIRNIKSNITYWKEVKQEIEAL